MEPNTNPLTTLPPTPLFQVKLGESYTTGKTPLLETGESSTGVSQRKKLGQLSRNTGVELNNYPWRKRVIRLEGVTPIFILFRLLQFRSWKSDQMHVFPGSWSGDESWNFRELLPSIVITRIKSIRGHRTRNINKQNILSEII